MQVSELNEVDRLIIAIFRSEEHTLKNPWGFSEEAIRAVKNAGYAVPCGNILGGLRLTVTGQRRGMAIAKIIAH